MRGEHTPGAMIKCVGCRAAVSEVFDEWLGSKMSAFTIELVLEQLV